MKQAILYLPGKGGNALEGERYRKNCPGFDILGVDYPGEFPWTAEGPIRSAYARARRDYDAVWLLANSIGAYFAMHALEGCEIQRALFISPILDMERLITDLMAWSGVREEELREKGEIPTRFGETLSWDYLCFVRAHPVRWEVPTDILYAEGDHLTSRETVERFVSRHPARLTVFPQGEHWFHTPEQLSFLDGWMKRAVLED